MNLTNPEMTLLVYLERTCTSPDLRGSVNGPKIKASLNLDEQEIIDVASNLEGFGLVGGIRTTNGVYNRIWITPEGRRHAREHLAEESKRIAEAGTRRQATIFYSWQSDLPNKTNRGFIEDCLERAIRELSAEGQLQVDPCLDRDTMNVPGSPDIAATIFEKIDSCAMFVGDVSIINKGESQRPTPNPNVAIELGYAVKSLGWNRVICVFNTVTGDIADLPFDLRQRRLVGYQLEPHEDKAEARTSLIRVLRASIEKVMSSTEGKDQPTRKSETGSEPRFLQFLDGLSGDEIYRLAGAVLIGSQTIRCGRNDSTAASLASKGMLDSVPFESKSDSVEIPYTIPSEVWRHLNNHLDWLVGEATRKNQSRPDRLKRLSQSESE